MKKILIALVPLFVFPISAAADSLSVIAEKWQEIKSLTKSQKLSHGLDAAETAGSVGDAVETVLMFRDLREEQKSRSDDEIEASRSAAIKALESRDNAFSKAVAHVMRPVVNQQVLMDRLLKARTVDEMIKAGEAINEDRGKIPKTEFEPKEKGLNRALMSFGGPLFGWIGSGLDSAQYGWRKASETKKQEPDPLTKVATLPSPTPNFNPISTTVSKPAPVVQDEPKEDCETFNATDETCDKDSQSDFKWRLVRARSASDDPNAYVGEKSQSELARDSRSSCHYEPGLLNDAHKVIELTLSMIWSDSNGCSKARNIALSPNSLSFDRSCRMNGNDFRYHGEVLVSSERAYSVMNVTAYDSGQEITYVEEFERCD